MFFCVISFTTVLWGRHEHYPFLQGGTSTEIASHLPKVTQPEGGSAERHTISIWHRGLPQSHANVFSSTACIRITWGAYVQCTLDSTLTYWIRNWVWGLNYSKINWWRVSRERLEHTIFLALHAHHYTHYSQKQTHPFNGNVISGLHSRMRTVWGIKRSQTDRNPCPQLYPSPPYGSEAPDSRKTN